MRPTNTFELALLEHAEGVDFASLPDQVVQAAESVLLDHLICASVGMSLPWVRLLRDQAVGEACGRGQRGAALIYGSTEAVTGRAAALVNGTAGHGFELDDTYSEGQLHPGSAIVPAVLAAADDEASGQDVLAALVAGYDVGGRLCHAIGTLHNYRGFHTTGVVGPVAAAVAVARVQGAAVDTIADATGIAASFSSGIKAFQDGGGMIKRLHAGRAAEGGVLAAELALRGFTGPRDALTGRSGFVDVYSLDGEARPELLAEGLGTEFVIDNMYIKQFCTCGRLHGPIMAAVELQARGVDPRLAEQIVVGGPRAMVEQNSIARPQDAMGAQYSVQYSVALGLLGHVFDLGRYQDSADLDAPDVRALMERMTVEVDEEAESHYPPTEDGHASKDGRVTLHYPDGRIESAYGSASKATSSGWDVVASKVERLWDATWGSRHPEGTTGLMDAVLALKHGGSVHDCLAMLPRVDE